MDYDDNDFQGQNLHLVGEGSSKLSPVLHSYSLPKFDFDDGLQGHLRFDSLVENEVFLGIPSQEDNHWIEDFSRGSSGIEFSSTAAESCSISRRHNVWSEATSSESVEMLLKSVGQEEMVHGETIVEESDVCHELGSLTDQMEPHAIQDEKVKDVVDSDPSLPSVEHLEHLSRLTDAKGTSQTEEAEISTQESSYRLNPLASSETRVIFVTENNSGVNRKCDNDNYVEVNTSLKESLDSRMKKDSSGSGMQSDDIGSSSQNNAASFEVLNNQENENQVSDVSFENANCVLTDIGESVRGPDILSKESDTDNSTLKGIPFESDIHNLVIQPCSSSKMEPIEQQTVEAGASNFEKPSSLPLKGDCNLQIVEACNDNLCSTDPDKGTCDPDNSTVIHQQFSGNMNKDLPVVSQGDSNLKVCVIEISNIKGGVSVISERKIDQSTHGDNSSVEGMDHLLGSHHQLDSEAPVIENKAYDDSGDGSSCNYVGDHSSLTVASSLTEFDGEKHKIGNLKGVDDASGVYNELLNADDCASCPIMAGSMQTYKGNPFMNPNEVLHDQDVSLNENEKSKLTNDSSSMEWKIVDSLGSDKRVEPASQGEGMKESNVVDHGLDFDIAARNEPGATKDKVTDRLDKNKTEVEALTEANLLLPKESSEMASKLGPVLELEKPAYHHSPQESLHEDVDQSLPAVVTCNLSSGNEHARELLHRTVGPSSPVGETSSIVSQSGHAVAANEISENSSNKVEVCPTRFDSTAKQEGTAGIVVPGNHESAKNNEVAFSKVEDSDKPNCGKPFVSSCTVLTQIEKDKKEGVKESMGRNVPFSEVILPLTPLNGSGNDDTKDDRSFTFEVHPSASLSHREISKDVQPFPTVQSHKIPTIVKGSPSASGVDQMDPKTISEVSHGSSRGRDGDIAHRGSKGTAERKIRRSSGKAAGKENAKKGNMKDTTPSRQSERRDDSCSVSVNPSGTTQLGQFEGLKTYGNVERSGTIPCSVVSIPTANLPDLNTSALSSALFQQPFTDLQQVQLRAQIFVYGSLIQGAAPDEACMISAFGASNGGRSAWEAVWRACVGRLQGGRPPDQSTKHGALQSKMLPSPVGQVTSKATPSPVGNSVIPVSSPVWNMSTPSSNGLQSIGMPRSGHFDNHQTPPLRSLQTPLARGFTGHNTSWLSQAPFPRPWVAPPQTSVFDSSARFSVLPMTETVKLTPIKESSAPFPSGTKHACDTNLVHSTDSSVFAGSSSLPEMKKVTLSSGQNSSDPKARKRKKVTVSEDIARISLLAQTRAEPVSVPLVTSHLSTSVVVSTPACFVSKGNTSAIITALSPSFSTDHPKREEQNAQQKATLSADTFSKVEEAKRVAEDAATLAAAAVSQSQKVWSQLDKQRSSGFVSDVEAKLASAAVAIAAAASVAKAAAAAANIASNAALQAKLMADEALISTVTSNSAQSHAASLSGVENLEKATPASILKGDDRSNSSSSIIVVAREAARRRIEAASAASKHAENLDAIVKAAELAAEAVSQAGKIVAMGDSLALNELVEAGPDRYWRVPKVPPEKGVMMNNGDREQSEVHSIKDLNVSGSHVKEASLEEVNTTNCDLSALSKEVSRETLGDHMRAVDGISSTFTSSSKKELRGQRNDRASDLAKTIGVVPESEIGSRSASITTQDEYEKGVAILNENNIKEGCLVEVHKDGDQFKAAWYSAKVLSLKDGKAFVAYLDLQSDNGSRQLKEWVALEGECNSAPQLRVDHRVATIRSEGARKRRRAAREDYVWSVGDRVDAWIQDCWREGIITEKNEKDDTALTVHFPAEGERSVVRAWHLRPTLIWKNGEWIEWSSSRDRDPLSQGDTPQEKRLKLASLGIEGKQKDKISEDIELVKSKKPAESRLLPLSANEKVFNVGKSNRDENKPALRTIRNGLQKEGSRVIFGVPKPGKKRKFMEVSKHYVAERSKKTNEPNDSFKLANYLMPQGSGSHGWKNTKINAKDKQPAESKPKGLKSEKLQIVSGRTIAQKGKFLNSEVSAENEGAGTDHTIKDSSSTDKNESGQQNLVEVGSFSNTDGASEGSVSFSSLALPSDAHSKKISTLKAKSDRVNKGTLVSTGKLPKVEVKGKLNSGNPGTSIPGVAEPRRSNRRIQPTSRLLEGLQSSLMITKIPAVSHDKSHRSQNRGTSKGNNHA